MTANKIPKTRIKPVKSILVSQPKPSNPNSPYFTLAEKYGLKVDFIPFIEVAPVDLGDFRKQKVKILDNTAVIFTSRNAIDHFFRICKGMKVEVPADMKYFCISEQTANYLQKYIVIRKRKIFCGTRTAKDLLEIIKKYPKEKFLYPCSDIRKGDIPEFMAENDFNFTEAVLYKTVASDLSHLDDVTYDIIAFFSPSGINSLYVNFPDFMQNTTRLAAFGPTTAQAVLEKGLFLDIQAPMPNAPSMTGAIEMYVKEVNELNK
ncbi:MAG: uroporphyrinogen-III synthase [Flammeovirgaceae bacterium]|jgi:uroporphyrinogen-III synthase